MATIRLNGVFPPIPTPFVQGEFSREHLAANVAQWNRTDISGFVALGSNGEYPYLSKTEKIQVVETVTAAAADAKTVIVGTGCESTRATIELTRDCAAVGAQAALVVTPHYYGGRMNDQALVRHYETIADAAPIPIILYNVPKFTHIHLSVPSVAHLAAHDNVVGIKDSAGLVHQLGAFINATANQSFAVMVGTAGALLGGLALGCSGGVLALANVAPNQCVQIQRLVAAGDLQAARELQLRMLPVNTAVTGTYGIPGLKAALDMLGYHGGDPRMPLAATSESDKKALRKILTEAGLLK